MKMGGVMRTRLCEMLEMDVPVIQAAIGSAAGPELAAGLTSAVTSPLAAAYAVSGALGWPPDLADRRFRLVWMLVLGAGTLAAALGTRPISAIVFAQAANGFLLPIVAFYLLYVMNNPRLLGQYRNRLASNLVGGAVVLVVAGLGVFKLLQAAGFV